jgi:phosphoribosylformimino-5-aminoimidazole carboxamide ribotide isomerase
MRVVAVLDLMGGKVVRGVGGRRAEYRPVVSRLTSSCDPLEVAGAFRQQLSLEELYLADLDAIAGALPALTLFERLTREGFTIWVDAGLRRAAEAESLITAGVARVVAGLETLAEPEELTSLCQSFGDRVVFSLDLKSGLPLGSSTWPAEPRDVAKTAVACGDRRLLLLDLARVGEGQGTGTEDLYRELRQTHPGIEISAGGGVRGVEDLRRLAGCGVAAVLVASALHDGRLTREDLASGGC